MKPRDSINILCWNRYFVLISFLLLAFFVCIIVLDQDKIALALCRATPIAVLVNLALLLMAFFLCLPPILTSLKSQKRKVWIFLIFYSLALYCGKTYFIPATHRVADDEVVNELTAIAIAQEIKGFHARYAVIKGGKIHNLVADSYMQPLAYPSILSVAFRIFGPNEKVAFHSNRILSSLTPALVGLLAGSLFNSTAIIFFASVLYGLLPPHLAFGNSASVEISTVFFCVLTFLAFILHKKKPGEDRRTFLAISVLALTIQFRSEMIFILPVIGYLYLLPGRENILTAIAANLKWVFYFCLLTFAHGLHLYTRSVSQGVTFAMDHFWLNLEQNTLYFLNNSYLPSLYTVLILFALLSINRFSKTIRSLFLWFFLFVGIFLFYERGGISTAEDSQRYLFISLIPFCLLSSQGISWLFYYTSSQLFRKFIAAVFICLIVVQTCLYWNTISTPSMEYYAFTKNHSFLKKIISHIPENAMIITEFPSLPLLLGRSSASPDFFDPRKPSGKDLALEHKNYLYLYKTTIFSEDKKLKELYNRFLQTYPHILVHKVEFEEESLVLYRLYP